MTGQAQKHFWCGGRPYGFRLKPVLDATRLDVYGQPARIGTVLEIDSEQVAIVRRYSRALSTARAAWRSRGS